MLHTHGSPSIIGGLRMTTNVIKPYVLSKGMKVQGTDVKAGETVFAIFNVQTQLFFIWSFTSEEYARKIAGRVVPEDHGDIANNWRNTTDELTISIRDRD